VFDLKNVPEVGAGETVTRHLMFSKWFRADQTIKYESFMPPNDLEYSITRLLEATDDELWDVGAAVATKSHRNLHGRADLSVQRFITQQLHVQADALSDNPNHAKATGWPADKARQIIIAKQIAATPGMRRIPPPG
jgi:hypothetical protein